MLKCEALNLTVVNDKINCSLKASQGSYVFLLLEKKNSLEVMVQNKVGTDIIICMILNN